MIMQMDSASSRLGAAYDIKSPDYYLSSQARIQGSICRLTAPPPPCPVVSGEIQQQHQSGGAQPEWGWLSLAPSNPLGWLHYLHSGRRKKENSPEFVHLYMCVHKGALTFSLV